MSSQPKVASIVLAAGSGTRFGHDMNKVWLPLNGRHIISRSLTNASASFNDARIDPWIPGKFAAKLQAYSTSKAPVFLDVIYDAGHEGGDTMEERIKEYSRIFAFAFWQTNHTLKI